MPQVLLIILNIGSLWVLPYRLKPVRVTVWEGGGGMSKSLSESESDIFSSSRIMTRDSTVPGHTAFVSCIFTRDATTFTIIYIYVFKKCNKNITHTGQEFMYFRTSHLFNLPKNYEHATWYLHFFLSSIHTFCHSAVRPGYSSTWSLIQSVYHGVQARLLKG